MKNIFFVAIALLSIFSCKQNGNKGIIPENANEIAIQANFVIDSLKVEDSLIVKGKLNYDSNYSLLIFPEIRNTVLLDSIYAPVSKNFETKIDKFSKNDLSLKLKEISEKNKKEYFNEVEEIENPTMEYTAYDVFGMRIFKNNNSYITIKYDFEGMSPGAAHPFHNSKLITFDFKNNKQIHLDDIFINKNKFWKNIVPKYIPKDMVFDEYKKSVPITENLNFDDKYINLNYNKYEIGAYTSGLISIQIPFSEIKPYLKPEFISRNNIK